MTLPSRKTLLANAFSLLALAWLYGGDLRDALRAREAEVAGYFQLPSVLMPSLVLALTAAVLAVVAFGLVRRKGEDFKGYRLLPILLVGALLVDLVLSESSQYLDSSELTVAAMQDFRELAQELATEQEVPADPAVLGPLVEKLGRAPYLVRGQHVGNYALQVRQGCQGPAQELSGARPGTLLYCVGPERREAWISAVGLPVGERFGGAAVLAVRGTPVSTQVLPQPPGGQADPLQAAGLTAAELEGLHLDGGVVGAAEQP
jgi:hypothetical protein